MPILSARPPKNTVETANGRDTVPLAPEPKHLVGSPLGSNPPRLRRQDLEHPENFHKRLAAWLMKQR